MDATRVKVKFESSVTEAREKKFLKQLVSQENLLNVFIGMYPY